MKLEIWLCVCVCLSHHHGVYLPFDLLVPGQRSLQTLFGVQLRVPALINVTGKTKWAPQRVWLRMPFVDVHLAVEELGKCAMLIYAVLSGIAYALISNRNKVQWTWPTFESQWQLSHDFGSNSQLCERYKINKVPKTSPKHWGNLM